MSSNEDASARPVSVTFAKSKTQMLDMEEAMAVKESAREDSDSNAGNMLNEMDEEEMYDFDKGDVDDV